MEFGNQGFEDVAVDVDALIALSTQGGVDLTQARQSQFEFSPIVGRTLALNRVPLEIDRLKLVQVRQLVDLRPLGNLRNNRRQCVRLRTFDKD